MKSSVRMLVPVLLAMVIGSLPGRAQQVGIKVVDIAIASGLDPSDRQPLDIAGVFPSTLGKVYCFTRIRGAQTPTTVTHAWYYEGETMARVELPVLSQDWRTWSSKKYLGAWQGNWQVKILDEEGLVLDTIAFRVVEAGSPELPTVDPEGAEQ